MKEEVHRTRRRSAHEGVERRDEVDLNRRSEPKEQHRERRASASHLLPHELKQEPPGERERARAESERNDARIAREPTQQPIQEQRTRRMGARMGTQPEL